MNVEALRALEKAVEAGEPIAWGLGGSPARKALPTHWKLAMDAFCGDMDAAMSLLASVLPGWDYSIDNVHRIDVHVYLYHDAFPSVCADNPDPARAVLLAIIRALIAQAEKGEG